MNSTFTSYPVFSDDIRVDTGENGEDIFIFDPYNPLNKLITKEEIESILSKYGITMPIHNIKLYQRAFIHSSYVRKPPTTKLHILAKPNDCLKLSSKSNDRLECIGDGILELITKYYLYRRYPKEDEGFMTEKKIAIVKNEAIGRLAIELGLHKWYIVSRCEESKGIRNNLEKLGCVFEAFIGAIFLDYNKLQINDTDEWFSKVFTMGPGVQVSQIFIENVFEKHIDWVKLISEDENYKNILQVYMQQEFKKTPDYIEDHLHNDSTVDGGYTIVSVMCFGMEKHEITSIKQTGIPFTKFKSFAEIHQYLATHTRLLLVLGQGSHKIKKKASQLASKNALIHIQTGMTA